MWGILLFLPLVHFVCSGHVPEHKTYENYKYIKVQGERDGIEILRKALLESDNSLAYSDGRDGTEFAVGPDVEDIFYEIIEEKGLKATVVYDDISKIIGLEKSMLRGKNEFSWTAYYDIDDIHYFLTNMSTSYPNLSELIVGGRSYQGRSLLGLRINTPGEDGVNKPVIFIESGIHAREWIAPATTTYFINELLTSNDANIQAIRDQFDWRIFPSVNPDGYHFSYTVDRMWRKTVSRSNYRCFGADANRNWDYNWGQYSSTNNPCDYQTYAGATPFSEIETRSLSEYIQSIDNLKVYVSFHSYAAMLLLPYSDSSQHVHNYEDLVRVGNASLDYGSKVSKGERYRGPGTAADMLYKASGGSMDWVRHALGTPLVYTYELRGNSFHWPPSRIAEQGEEVTQMLLGLVTEANKLGYY